jgi:hypothetical protein
MQVKAVTAGPATRGTRRHGVQEYSGQGRTPGPATATRLMRVNFLAYFA